MPIIGRKSARLRHGALEIPSHIFGYVLAESGWHQLALAVLTAIVFLLEIVPLELQRRIINDLAKDRNFRFVILLCVAYGGTVLVQGGTKAIVNIYRSWVAERATRDLRRQVHNSAPLAAHPRTDLWDTSAVASPGLDKYKPFVQALADKTIGSGLEVLLLNGDTHLFHVDHPLADANSVTGKIYGLQAVPNLTRITVQGSINKPSEWLKLTIDGRRPYPYSWQNVVYCQNPLHEDCSP